MARILAAKNLYKMENLKIYTAVLQVYTNVKPKTVDVTLIIFMILMILYFNIYNL